MGYLIYFIFAITPFVIEQPPKIDGRLESIWFNFHPITGFIQQQPEEGKLALEKTEVYLLKDDSNLYIVFVCYTNGRKPEVNIRRWDSASGDRVSLYLDTFEIGEPVISLQLQHQGHRKMVFHRGEENHLISLGMEYGLLHPKLQRIDIQLR